MAPAASSCRAKKSNRPIRTQMQMQMQMQPSSSTSSIKQGGGRLQVFNPRKIFVGGLPHETNNEHLHLLFQKYGSIADAVVLFHSDGRPRGFGYVTFSQARSAQGALADKSNHLILAQEVDAKRAVPGTNKLFVGGLHQLVTDADLRACFAAFGEVADAYVLPDTGNGRSRGFGFVSYMPGTEGSEAVDKAISKRWHRLHGKRFEAKLAKTPHQMAAEAGQAGQADQARQGVPKPFMPPGLFDDRKMTVMFLGGSDKAMEAAQSRSPSSTTSGTTATLLNMEKKAMGSPSNSNATTPNDSQMMLKPLLPLTPEAAPTSPSFDDSPKRLTLETAPAGFWQNVGGKMAIVEAGVDAGSTSRWPCSSSERSIAHLGPPPGIFKQKDATVEKMKIQKPKHGPMLLGFEKLAMNKKGK